MSETDTKMSEIDMDFLIKSIFKKFISRINIEFMINWYEEYTNDNHGQRQPKIELHKPHSVMKSLTGKKKGFENAVLVRMAPDSEVRKVGFVTDDTLKELGSAPEGYVMVYVPLALTIMGDMYVVPPSYVEPLNGKTGDIMKYIIAGGVTGQG